MTKKLFSSLALIVCLSACASFCLSPKSPFVGIFNGRWESAGAAGGNLRFTITEAEDKKLSALSSFTFNDTDVHAKTESLVIDGDKFTIILDWEIQSTSGTTKLTGTLVGDQIKGTYINNPSEEPATGTWSVTRVITKP